MTARFEMYLDTRSLNRFGEHVLYFRTYREKKYILISTRLSCRQGEFDGREFAIDSDDSAMKNIRLSELRTELNKFIITYDDTDKTNKEVKYDLERTLFPDLHKARPKTLCDVMQEYRDECITKPKTKLIYTNTLKWVEKYKDTSIALVTKEWLIGFEKLLRQSLKTNSVSIHLRNVRTCVNYAISMQYISITKYAFRSITIKHEETRKRSLTYYKIRQLRDFPLTDPALIEARDMWMLEFYLLGVNNVDLFNARPNDLVESPYGDTRFIYNRSKTDKLYDIAVPEEALEIINKYKGEKFLLNARERYTTYEIYARTMNDHLKEIGADKNLFSDLTFYWARHSFASLMAELDIPMETISRALGHSTACSTTQIYISFSRRKVDEAQQEMLSFLKSSYTIKEWEERKMAIANKRFSQSRA